MKDDQFDSVIESLNGISDNLNQGIAELFIAPLVATFLGALFAYMFSLYQSGKQDKQRSTSILARDLALEIAEVDVVCAHYWSTDFDNVEISEENLRAAQIKKHFMYVSKLTGEFSKKIPKDGTTSEMRNALLQFYETGYDIATGDDFESVERKANHEKIKEIAHLSSSARTLLTRYF